ncbi:hypothetical protein BRM3_07320 [Brachybacterium huguangmaarense]|uniref:Uncharacterized protein n=1 Tax=Brachybacterium huguangmaarense TaxID=1652028 RepID=A0ABY6FX19_9MICO|nr:hypothetical protein [Brachybacterium huguangmaarense]UYG15464.1 hypothetical protein BRM3_07320 [Brachybacterium huguangmaarense]
MARTRDLKQLTIRSGYSLVGVAIIGLGAAILQVGGVGSTRTRRSTSA